MLCPECGEFVFEDARRLHGECMTYERNGRKVVPCPCCFGWGEHIVDDITTGNKRVCGLCKGRRMVIERTIYETVPEIKPAPSSEPQQPTAPASPKPCILPHGNIPYCPFYSLADSYAAEPKCSLPNNIKCPRTASAPRQIVEDKVMGVRVKP